MAHILIIDDNIEFRGMLKEMMAELGHTVGEASDGESGLQVYKSDKFDLVFTDVIMAGREGIETIMLLRGENINVKIVVMSGGGELAPDDYLPMTLQLGARRTMKKPFRLEELRETIDSVLAE